MFFESVDEILEIAGRTGCAVFVVPESVSVKIPGAMILEPEGKTTISIEQVKEVISRLSIRQVQDLFILVRPADKLGDEAANALLKSLEEPKEKVHFVLVTDSPSRMLPTILSRSAVYFLREEYSEGISADARVMELAKRLIAAKQVDLVGLAEELTKKKDGVRNYVLSVLAVAIEMLYKSYYKTGKEAFLAKLPKFLKAYESIAKNGHIKLHLVADLI
ncbi:MAG: hypothetical protein Q4B29_00975 [Candidatus Saccharibacteria bacterium]|nr:hypothetical protein [Candidatus Saccharibacteria bacterium]